MAKKTLIIGGSSGIGFAVAGALAEQGESLILAGRDGEKLARARQFLSQKKAAVNTVVLDISKEEEVIQLSQTLGEVDNIIVTAGSHAPGGALTSLDLNEARLAFDSKFWDAELARINRRRPQQFACSLLLARRLMPSAKPEMAARGLFTSWATPAANTPMVAIFSAW